MQKTNKKETKNLVHVSFEIAIIIKGIDGLLEILGGILLIFINPDRLSRLIKILTREELLEDPKDKIANALIAMGQKFSIDAQSFGIFYLMSHGIVKLIIVFLLWRRKLWAYPLAVISLLLFIAYQIYRYFLDYSIGMLLLTAFDLLMIILTILEYKRMKEHFEV